MARELKLKNPIVLGSLSADPGTGFNGEIYYNTSTNKFRAFENGAWADLGGGSLIGSALNVQNVVVGNPSNLSASVDTSSVGDVLADSTNGLTLKAGIIDDADVNASAAIALTKLAALSSHNRALQSDNSGFISESSVTSTELGYVSGVTSAIQTQLNGKQATGNYITVLTGDVIASGPGSALATISSTTVTGKLLTGFSASPGTVTASDTILSAFNKIVGNFASEIIQGGNAFGAPFVVGSTDNFSVNILVDNVSQYAFESTGTIRQSAVATGPMTLQAGTPSTSNTAGQNLLLRSGAPNGAADAGFINFTSASAVGGGSSGEFDGGGNDGSGGTITLQSGAGSGSFPGDFHAIAGDSTTSASDGGWVYLNAGNSVAPSNGGSIQLTPGTGAASGQILLSGPVVFSSTINTPLTASRAVVTDGSSDLSASATTSTEIGYVSGVTSSIQTQLNGKQATGNYITALTGDATASGPGSVTLTLATVNSNVGSFTNASITVNAKGLITAASSGTTGNLTDAGTDGITITGGTGAVLGSGTTISQHVADASHNGYLTSTDWSTFNNKAPTASPTFTGTVTLPSGSITSSAWDTGTSTFTSNGVAFTSKAPSASPTFTGTVTLPSGSISSSAWDTGTSTFTSNGVAFTSKVTGPGSATNLAIVRFDGTTGALVKDTSTTTIDNSGNIFMGTSKLFFETPGTSLPAYGVYRTGGMLDFFVNNNAFTPSFRIESGGTADLNPSAGGALLNLGGSNFGGTATVAAGSSTGADGTNLNLNAGNTIGVGNAGGAWTGHAGDQSATSGTSPAGKALLRGGNQNAGSGTNNGGDAELRGGNSANAGNGGSVLLTPGTTSTGLPGAVIHAGRISYTGIQRETSSTTVTIANNTSVFIADYGSVQGSATITLPASTSLTNGQRVAFGSGTNGITSLTLSAGSGTTITGAITSLTVGQSAEYIYVTASTTWYRVS